MKRTFFKPILLAVIFCAAIASSCKKEEVVGPKGDKGDKGEAGVQGSQGVQGAQGNANVKNVITYIAGSEWINSPGTGYVTKLIPEITSEIINKGAVMVYSEAGNGWQALPSTSASTNGAVLAFGYYIESGKLTIEYTVNANVTLTAADIGNWDFKTVIISGEYIKNNPTFLVKNLNK